ncbi:MAG: hypothetical protein K9J81_02085 [Desulfohalobiaceae bacterium]|nr:hypothetical protein [Desulfohalobiaceae bacterium]
MKLEIARLRLRASVFAYQLPSPLRSFDVTSRRDKPPRPVGNWQEKSAVMSNVFKIKHSFGFRCRVSALPLAADVLFDRKRNFESSPDESKKRHAHIPEGTFSFK